LSNQGALQSLPNSIRVKILVRVEMLKGRKRVIVNPDKQSQS